MNEITEKQYRLLKQDVEEAKTEADKAKGALEATIATLKTDYGVSSIKEAKVKLAKLREEKETAGLRFERTLKEYKRRWHGDE